MSPGEPGRQARWEATRFGKLAVSVFVTAVLAAAVIQNVPAGDIDRRLSGVVPYASLLGLEQKWSIFAPDPFRIAVIVEAEIRYADGTTGHWAPHKAGPLVGAYRDFRWRKYEELLWQDRYAGLRRPTVEYVARLERSSGRRPVRIELIRRWYALRPPGPGPDRGPWQRARLYSLALEPGGR